MTAQERYQAWLHDFATDEQTVSELKAIAGNAKEITDRFYRELEFATAGMRGVIGAGTNRMNAYNVRRATKGLADLITEQGRQRDGVVIAYDSRRCSAEFALEAALVLCASGVTAHLFESLRPVPVLSFSVRHLSAAAGIVITASHNPKEYNGYKVYGPDGGQMPPEATEQLVAHIQARTYAQSLPMAKQAALDAGLLRMVPAAVDDSYIARVKSLCVQPELCQTVGRTLRIIYTPLNGSGNVPVRRVLREVGFLDVRVVPEQENPDPDFTTVGTPNPENKDAFRLAIALAEETQAELIFGTDPDSDRLGVVVKTESGYRTLTGNQIGCLLTAYILEGRRAQGTLPKNGAIVKSIVSTEMARAIADSFGVTTVDVLTGFKFIAEQIQLFEESGSHDFLFGFEESYGYLSGTFVRDKDAVIASLLIAETACAYKKRGMSLWDGLQDLYKRYGYYGESVISMSMPGQDGVATMQAAMRGLRDHPPACIGGSQVVAVRDYLRRVRTAQGVSAPLALPESDALYYELSGDEWVCVRPSGTEPKIKLYFNTRTAAAGDVPARLAALETDMRAIIGAYV